MSGNDTDKKTQDEEDAKKAYRVHGELGTPMTTRRQEEKPVRHEASAYEEYLYGRSIFSDYKLKPNWSSTTEGRATIRLISRGIFGAAAFAFATRYAGNQLRNYEPDLFKWGEVKFTEKPLQYVAKFWDIVAGKPIYNIVHWAAPAGQKETWAANAVRFRPKNYFHSDTGLPVGRSLGAEIVSVTFDFSAMSLADALGRNVIQAFDPNLVQPWFVDKKGNASTREHGHFDIRKWGKAVIRATWRSITKNAGEDWFAALPYVYQMKWQREALSKIPAFAVGTAERESPKGKKLFDGFKTSWDRNRNGGSLIVNNQGEIVGDYQLAGLLDLQGRFVGYNVYTLMYRELYDYLSRKLFDVYKHGIHLSEVHLPQNPLASAVRGLGSAGRYIIKSTIKANLFMQPAVPFFWMFRVPQSKWRSEIILQGGARDQQVIGTWAPTKAGTPDPSRPDVYRFPEPLPYDKWVRPQQGLTGKSRPDFIYFGEQKVPFPKSLASDANGKQTKGVYHFDNCPTLVSKILNPFGWISYTTGTILSRGANAWIKPESWLSQTMSGIKLAPGTQITKELANQIKLENTVLIRTYADAAWSYTPYFIAKDEFGLRVNDTPATGGIGKMDKAIYGLIDNMFTFKFKDAGKSAKEIWKLSTDDLRKQNVVHYEGKGVDKTEKPRAKHEEVPMEEEPTASPAPAKENNKPDDKAKEAKKPSSPVSIEHTRPTTKVQAVSVQYNVSPPTHLQHRTAAQTAQQQPDAAHWADTMAGRHKQGVDDPSRPTIH